MFVIDFVGQERFSSLNKNKNNNHYYPACGLAEWVAFLHAVVIATVVMCRVRNPACTTRERPGVGALYKW